MLTTLAAATLGSGATRLGVNGITGRDLAACAFPLDEPLVLHWSGAGSSFSVRLAGAGAWQWSSGVVRSNGTSLRLPAAAASALHAASTYTWSVALDGGAASAESAFDTAPTAAMWEGTQWIGGGSELRADLELPPKRVARARAYVTGLGAFELHVNGAKVGDHLLDPGYAVFDQKVLYVTHDLTGLLRSGHNAVGARVGNGRWGYLDIYENRTALGDQSGDSSRCFRALIAVQFDDGTELLSGTQPGAGWQYRHGPVVYDHVWHGAIYDTRLEAAPSWSAAPLPSYPAGTWAGPARRMAPKVGKLYPQLMPPVRSTATFRAVSTAVRNAGQATQALVLDFGRNMAGYATITVEAARIRAALAGDASATIMIRLEHTEITAADGQPDNQYFPGMEFHHASKTCSMRDWYQRKWYECANQTDALIISGDVADLAFAPLFTYHGFRHVLLTATEIDAATGAEQPLRPALAAAFPFGIHAVAHRIHSDLTPLTEITIGNGDGGAAARVLGAVFNATLRAHVSNVMSIPTDCPQREKRGWMADAGISSSSLQTLFDAMSFHLNFLKLIRDNQIKGCTDQPTTTIYGPCSHPPDSAAWFNGSVPDQTPFSSGPYGSNPGTTDWQTAYPMIARAVLAHHGARAAPALADLWPSLELFMSYLQRLVDPATGLLLQGARGDWVPPIYSGRTKTPPEMAAAFYHTLSVAYMAEIATAIGQPAEAARYAARLAKNRVAFHRHFYDGSKGCGYAGSSQTACIFALKIGAVPANLTAAVTAGLVQSIRIAPEGKGFGPGPHIDVGIFGATHVFEVLRDAGLDALAFDVLKQETWPSLGYMTSQGATTLWETWSGTPHQIGPGGTSRNHIMYGGGCAKFIAEAVGGLGFFDEGRDLAAPWSKLRVHPAPAAVREIGAASHSRITPHGRAAVSWSLHSGVVHLNITVPPGSLADVQLPVLRPCRTSSPCVLRPDGEHVLPLALGPGDHVVSSERV